MQVLAECDRDPAPRRRRGERRHADAVIEERRRLVRGQAQREQLRHPIAGGDEQIVAEEPDVPEGHPARRRFDGAVAREDPGALLGGDGDDPYALG